MSMDYQLRIYVLNMNFANTVLSHLRRMRLAFSKKFKDTYDFSYLSQSVQYSFRNIAL